MLCLLPFATWLAAQTEGQDDSDRERESAVPEPGEKKYRHFTNVGSSATTVVSLQQVI